MSEEVTILDKTFVKYIRDEEINAAVAHVAAQINHDYQEEPPLILITLNGAIVFAVDLLKQLTINARITCVKLSSYEGTESTNKINQLIGLSDDVNGKRVLIVEDIVDTGRTYQHLWNMLHEAGVKEVRIATMTMKPDAYKLDLPVHYVGFSIPNKFVVGRGLDYDGYGRQLPDIYQLKTEGNGR